MTPQSRQHPLVEVLRTRNTGLADQAMRVIGEAHRVLDYTLSTFSGGTDHTRRHTTTVEQIGRMLLPDSFLDALTDEELFFLAVACHHHDLAMAGTEADDRTPETREQVRRDHAIRIGTIVRQRWAALGFEDERTAQVLGEVCRGHRPKKSSEGEANWDELNSVEVLRPDVWVRVRLLSALTYAIDELHLGADRAPARVQNWRDLRDEESRRHWRRHQAVNGPCRTAAGSILFQVNADTPGFEENLRAQVFRKALGAVRDLRRQVEVDRVTVHLPDIEVQWDRKATWDALFPLVCADLRPRTRDEITQALLDRLGEEAAMRTDLSGLCTEQGSSEAELRAGACRCVEDAAAYRHLVEAPGEPGGLVLSPEEQVANLLFARLRGADELDQLYLGRYAPGWEERLFGSPYGRAYVAGCVLPTVGQSYSLPLTARPENDPVRTVLELCPSATRLALQFRPPPSNLVKATLLRLAALTGALFDLHAAPVRLLDRRLRAAVRSLAGSEPATLSTIRLLEEMALVGGLTHEQVLAAHNLSEAARQALDTGLADGQREVHVGLTQTVPADAPATTTYLPRLLLAGRRAVIPILLTKVPGHALDLRVTPAGALPVPPDDSFVLGVGPGMEFLGPARLPARVEVNRTARTIRFYLSRFSAACPSPSPVVVRLPLPPQAGERPAVQFGATIHWPKLTVRDLRALEAAAQLLRTGAGRVELLVEESGALLASMNPRGSGELFRLGRWTAEVLRGCRGLDVNLPAPLFVPVEQIAAFGRQTASERQARWQALREVPEQDRPLHCSVYLRIANAAGLPVDETFLRFLPGHFFSAPTVEPGGAMSQEDFERLWQAGAEDFLLTGFFETDIHDLAQCLRDWCRNPGDEFPFRLESGGVPSPLTRSALAIRFLPITDRIWHRDQPVVFEFRPISPQEAHALEADYWRSVNDDRRAELADEIRARLEEAAGTQPAAPGLPHVEVSGPRADSTEHAPGGEAIVRVNIRDFLEDVYGLAARGDLQSATDRVFDTIDRLLCDGSDDICDEILSRVDVPRLPTGVIRSFLTITAPAKERLPSRPSFFAKAQREVTRLRGADMAQRLLGKLA
jgi:hypothetical protein